MLHEVAAHTHKFGKGWWQNHLVKHWHNQMFYSTSLTSTQHMIISELDNVKAHENISKSPYPDQELT